MRAVKGIPRTIGRATGLAVAALAGKIAARKGRGLAGQAPGELLGSAIELGIGLGGALALHFVPVVGEIAAEGFLAGSILAVGETQIQRLGIPHISDSLGDDGYYVGGNTGLGLVSAEPDDYRPVVGSFVPGGGPGGSAAIETYLAGLNRGPVRAAA